LLSRIKQETKSADKKSGVIKIKVEKVSVIRLQKPLIIRLLERRDSITPLADDLNAKVQHRLTVEELQPAYFRPEIKAIRPVRRIGHLEEQGTPTIINEHERPRRPQQLPEPADLQEVKRVTDCQANRGLIKLMEDEAVEHKASEPAVRGQGKEQEALSQGERPELLQE